jgi:hypothetical protein
MNFTVKVMYLLNVKTTLKHFQYQNNISMSLGKPLTQATKKYSNGTLLKARVKILVNALLTNSLTSGLVRG